MCCVNVKLVFLGNFFVLMLESKMCDQHIQTASTCGRLFIHKKASVSDCKIHKTLKLPVP